MPIVEVTYGSEVGTARVTILRELLPEAVSLGVQCPEEPFDGILTPGDVEIRFRPVGPHDLSRLDVVVEVRSKWFASRAETRQQRCDQICSAISSSMGDLSIGVYLSLPIAAWSQSA